MNLLLSTLVVSLGLLKGGHDSPKPLSTEGEASKAAFEALLKSKEGVGEARLKSLSLPGTREFLSSEEAMTGFVALNQSFQKDSGNAPEAFRLLAALLPKIDHLRAWDGYQSIYLVRAAQKSADPQTAERLRLGYAALIKRSIAKRDFGEGRIAEIAPEYYGKSLAHLTGSALRGELMNRPAAPLPFLWSSDPSLRSLADLKGKVVVLDFWATWCKPCIGLFPKIRDVSAAYAGKPVAFVGVTSLQGFSMDPKLGRVDCKGDPKKETALMPDLMKALGITWTVAFSEKDCFNPDFDVMGIPHMAILDAKGVVRYDDVEPDAIREKIDGLLAEAAR